MNLHHHTLPPRHRVPNLGDAVSWSSNFKENFALHIALLRSNHKLRIFCVTSSTSGEVGLMLFALGVSEVGTFVGVECQAKTTFE